MEDLQIPESALQRARARSSSSASAEYIEGLESDLSAAREQLADMRILLTEAYLLLGQGFMGYSKILKLLERINEVLSAAPAGGRVLDRLRGSTYQTLGRLKPRHVIVSLPTGSFRVADDIPDGLDVEVIVKKYLPSPSADEE